MTMILLVVSLLVSCGASESPIDSSSVSTEYTAKGCPVGSWNDKSMSNHASVGNTGVVSLNMGNCKSIGYITCTDNQNFVLTIQSAEWEEPGESNCQFTGVYTCSYSKYTDGFIVWCPSDEQYGNRFKNGMEFFYDNGY